jgi:hypothetical protein
MPEHCELAVHAAVTVAAGTARGVTSVERTA